jgi:hypothetical protein
MRYREVWGTTLVVSLVLVAAFAIAQCVWERL